MILKETRMALAFKAGSSMRQVAKAFGVPKEEVERAVKKYLWPVTKRKRRP